MNYTSGTTAKPKGVMITHRNAWANAVGTLVHFHITVGDRYLWTLPMFHANGWTFVWIITAVGGTHICLPKVEPARVFDLVRKEKVGWLCAAPTILIGLASAPADVRGDGPKGVQGITAGAAPAAEAGDVVMTGYYNAPEATKNAMGNGWFHTGDAAVLHPDGYVEIRDRIKDVIISGGENISSLEVEGVLLRHPAVQEVAIVGLPH